MTPDICRVCLQIVDDPIDMTFVLYKESIQVSQIFQNCTGLTLNSDKNNVICSECERRLYDAYEFKEQAKEAEKVLTQSDPFSVTKIENKEDDKDFYWNEPIHEPLVTILKKEDNSNNDELKVKKIKKRVSFQLPGMTNRFQCRFCLQTFVEGLREHEKMHIAENGGYECHHCPKKFINRDRIYVHLKVVHFSNKDDPNRPKFPCDICGKEYIQKSSLQKHKKFGHSGTPLPKEICPYCGKEQFNLKVHIRIVHTGTIVCYCEYCNKGFKTKGALKVHIKHVHLNIKEFQCPICLKFYRSRREIKTHTEAVHVDEQRFSCESCGKKFKSEASYKNHKKMHVADFDFKCEICDARFKSIAYLRGHLKVHNDRKDYSCSICAEAFKRKEQLRRHMRKHNGIRFPCPLCPGVSFLDKGYLKEHHERVHIGIRYRCDVCGKDYGCKKHLVQHQKASKCDRNKWTRIVPEGYS
uniref:CSON009245 protein n=1 Tax=Culicoides sonorensis TaxID=179676 RepID=A0A336MXB8_CULSO